MPKYRINCYYVRKPQLNINIVVAQTGKQFLTRFNVILISMLFYTLRFLTLQP